jgi:Tfp pilus assembly protein FimT
MKTGVPRGFTIVELTVALFVTAEVILAALALFDFHNKLAHVQTSISDMQQSLRVAQYEMVRLARMAGRGGMPVRTPQSPPQPPGPPAPAWGAVAVRNNVGGPVPDTVAIGFTGSPKAVDGTDILTLRGVFSTPIFQLNPAVGSLQLNGLPAAATAGSVVVCTSTPTGIAQDLGPLTSAVTLANAATPAQTEALILVSPLNEGIYGVVELDPGSSVLNTPQPLCPGSAGIKIAFKISGDANAVAFQALSSAAAPGGLPSTLTSAAWLGILEEYRYYVRQDYAVAGDPTSDPTPHLSRARMYPGTETPYYNDPANLQVDVADNVLDLQVALGVDLDGDGAIAEATPPSTADEWIYNVANDVSPLQPPPAAPPRLRELRISTLATTAGRDFQYQGPLLTNIEDHVYKPTDFPNTPRGRAYRHRLLQTVVGLRNL